MTTIAQIILAIALVLSIILPFGYYLIGEKNRGRYKTALGVNAFFFFGTMLIAIAVMFTGASSVQAAAGSEGTLATGMGYIAADFLLVRSRALRAASRALCARTDFSTVVFATVGFCSRKISSCLLTTLSTAPLASLFPSFCFV